MKRIRIKDFYPVFNNTEVVYQRKCVFPYTCGDEMFEVFGIVTVWRGETDKPNFAVYDAKEDNFFSVDIPSYFMLLEE